MSVDWDDEMNRHYNATCLYEDYVDYKDGTIKEKELIVRLRRYFSKLTIRKKWLFLDRIWRRGRCEKII